MEYLKMAFRNLLRHKRRSILTGLGMFIGSLLLVYTFANSAGLERQLIENMVISNTGHIKITARTEKKSSDFEKAYVFDGPLLKNSVPVERELVDLSGVELISKQAYLTGMISNGDILKSGTIIGIEPEKETKLFQRIIPAEKGQPLGPGDYYQIYISTVLAEIYKVTIGDTLTILAQTPDGQSNLLDFNIKGIFSSSSPQTERYSYIPLSALQELAGLSEGVHVIKVMLNNPNAAMDLADQLRKTLASKYHLEIKDWKEAGGFFLGTVVATQVFNVILCVVLFIIIAAGIMNTMLMSVYGRIKEIGTLMAMGTKPRQILYIFVTEAFMLGALTAGSGAIFGGFLMAWLGRVGIPAFTESLRYAYGGDRVFPHPTFFHILLSFLSIITLAVAASIYPAYTAARLKPVEALSRKQ